jgi:hypothetical protein
MSEGEGKEKPGTAPKKYIGYEIFTTGDQSGGPTHCEFEIWKWDKCVHAGKVDVPSSEYDDRAHGLAERAARAWIDAREPAS